MAKQTTTTKIVKSKKKGKAKKGNGPKDKDTKPTRGQGR